MYRAKKNSDRESLSDGPGNGSDFDIAIFEVDGSCRVIASHSTKTKLPVGSDFFSDIGAQGSEVQFAFSVLMEKPFSAVLIHSGVGAVLLSGYYYLSSRLFYALIPHRRAESVARVAYHCFPEIRLSPTFQTPSDPVPGDEETYEELQKIRQGSRDCFPQYFWSEDLVKKNFYDPIVRMIRSMSFMVGQSYSVAYPIPQSNVEVCYDPVFCSLLLLNFSCFVRRIAPKTVPQISFFLESHSVRMELEVSIASPVTEIPELEYLLNLESYSRQMLELVRNRTRILLRVYLLPAGREEWLGLKNRHPGSGRIVYDSENGFCESLLDADNPDASSGIGK